MITIVFYFISTKLSFFWTHKNYLMILLYIYFSPAPSFPRDRYKSGPTYACKSQSGLLYKDTAGLVLSCVSADIFCSTGPMACDRHSYRKHTLNRKVVSVFLYWRHTRGVLHIYIWMKNDFSMSNFLRMHLPHS